MLLLILQLSAEWFLSQRAENDTQRSDTELYQSPTKQSCAHQSAWVPAADRDEMTGDGSEAISRPSIILTGDGWRSFSSRLLREGLEDKYEEGEWFSSV